MTPIALRSADAEVLSRRIRPFSSRRIRSFFLAKILSDWPAIRSSWPRFANVLSMALIAAIFSKNC